MSFPGSILLTQGDEYKQTSDKRHPFGTRGYTRDGRVFRYAQAGATALAVGKLCCGPVADSDYNEDINPDTSTAPSTSSTKVTLAYATGVTIAANEFAEGYLYINDGTGEGQIVQILSNDAVSAATTVIGDIYLMPDDCFTIAPTTACEFAVEKNKYDGLIVRPDSARTSIPVGVTPRTVTAAYYFWVQTWGPCACLLSSANAIGVPVSDDTVSATGTAGAIHTIRTTSTGAAPAAGAAGVHSGMTLGISMSANIASEYGLIDLQISP